MAEITFSRRVLLAVTGMSPQVVTETLYALQRDRASMPNEVIVMTTLQGKIKLLHGLLGRDGEKGYFHRFCCDYGLVGQIHFDEQHIRLIEDENGDPLPDIRTPEENQWAADSIIRMVAELCALPDSAVHVSIAGGRKSMGFFAGYALSLFGRSQDRLSHVLVNEPYEGNPAFYYPTPYSRLITDPKGLEFDAAKARVMLADIPLVRLRDGLPQGLLLGSHGYSQAVQMAQQVQQQAELRFDLKEKLVCCGGHVVKLSDTEMAVYLWFARNKQRGGCAIGLADSAQKDRYLNCYQEISGDSGHLDKARESLASDMKGEYFRPHLSRLNKKLERTLGKALAKVYKIHLKRKLQGYDLDILSERIRID